MAQTQQAKILNKNMIKSVLNHLSSTRYPARNKVIFLLGLLAGMRAKEIASISWRMCCDAEGNLTDEIVLENSTSKGKSGGRIIPMAKELKVALQEHYDISKKTLPSHRIIQTERECRVSAQVIVNMFQRWFLELGLEGCSSHSPRRTFITNTARKISSVGGSLRDIQFLAGHSSISTTEKYIDGATSARRKVVELVA